jgi:hypothetical protein
MAFKLKHMKYFLILFLVIVSCKKTKKSEIIKTIIQHEIVELNVGFYDLFLEYEAEQKLFKNFVLDTSKYFKTYVLQGQSKLIDRQFEYIKPSDILSKVELNELNYHTVFENYQWDFTINRSKFNTDFIERYKFNVRKPKTNKTEIIYFFTYPFSVAKDKVLIGFEIKNKSHNLKEATKRIYMGFIIFKKVNNKWRFKAERSLLKQ